MGGVIIAVITVKGATLIAAITPFLVLVVMHLRLHLTLIVLIMGPFLMSLSTGYWEVFSFEVS